MSILYPGLFLKKIDIFVYIQLKLDYFSITEDSSISSNQKMSSFSSPNVHLEISITWPEEVLSTAGSVSDSSPE